MYRSCLMNFYFTTQSTQLNNIQHNVTFNNTGHCTHIHNSPLYIPGPLLWYQQFEYAIGHWLQKATEDVFGCVMCAPGCFSLFRGSALMDDNVARTYATRATEAGHYIQYDQGTDRYCIIRCIVYIKK